MQGGGLWDDSVRPNDIQGLFMKRILSADKAASLLPIFVIRASGERFWTDVGWSAPNDLSQAFRFASPEAALRYSLTLNQSSPEFRTAEKRTLSQVDTSNHIRLARDHLVDDWRTLTGKAFPREMLDKNQNQRFGYLTLLGDKAGSFWTGRDWTDSHEHGLRFDQPLLAYQFARRLAQDEAEALEGNPVYLYRYNQDFDEAYRLFSNQLDANRPRLRVDWETNFHEQLPEAELFPAAPTEHPDVALRDFDDTPDFGYA